MNLLDLYRRDGHPARKATAKEWEGPCPACGGENRFCIWPDQGRDKLGDSWCRQCGKKWDAIQYLRDFHGLGFREACDQLGIMLEDRPRLVYSNNKKPGPIFKPKWEPAAAENPKPIWQHRAKAFVGRCAAALIDGHEGTAPITEWLAERGINWSTVKKSKLGINTKDRDITRTRWGLDVEPEGYEKFKIPTGLVLPWIIDDEVVTVQVRGEKGYKTLPGSRVRPFLLGDEGLALVVVESFLDGLLVHQEAGDLVGVVVTGSATNRPKDDLAPTLKQAKKILVALDSDETGTKSAWGWWIENFEQAKCWLVTIGKDPGEAFQGGLDLRAWVLAGLYAAGLLGDDQMEQLTETSDERFQRTQSEAREKRKKRKNLHGRKKRKETP